MTAMDAGFWTAMRIQKKWLRDLASIVFTVYYLIAAEQADEKVRKVRGALTVDHMRVSWNKGTTPYISFLSKLVRPRLMRYPPRAIRIPRPASSDYKEPVNGWLYFDGPLTALKNHTNMVLDIPGGGYVAMDPRTNDDKLMAWAGKTGLPVLSLDYGKAPEYPYPYALNECFDVYHTLITSRGRCIGLSGDAVPGVVITGDSAGGGLATAAMLTIIESNMKARSEELALPIPDGLILIYPGLDMNIGTFMSDEQMSLIKDRRTRKQNKNIIRRKSMQYTNLAGTPHHSEDEGEGSPPKLDTPSVSNQETTASHLASDDTAPKPEFSTISPSTTKPPPLLVESSTSSKRRSSISHRPEPLKTRLAMSSMISYFNDRILAPELMRSMIILYIGPHNRPDFATDYHLSPILAPEVLLSRFPKTYFITGERDPLVDDTVIMAGRLRRAKAARHDREVRNGGGSANWRKEEFNERDAVEVVLIPGISHGFFQFVACFPEGWKHIYKCGKWIDEIFETKERKKREAGELPTSGYFSTGAKGYGTASSGDEDTGLEMSMSSKGERIGSAAGARNRKEREKLDTRKRKERLLREHAEEMGRGVREGSSMTGKRQKSMVSLGSSDDLLGRRMLGLAGPLTGMGMKDN